MRLLVITQKVDKGDAILGFFHTWIVEFSKKFEAVSVVCLEKGECDFPHNVKVYSLGKESRRSRIKYITNFYNYIVGLNREYDAVFVHMNQEYIILGGIFWKLLRKKIYFWRNHPHGSLLTRIAVWLSNKVFCTSSFSYTAKFKKTVLMPVGIDTELFKSIQNTKYPYSILSLGRISPVKNIHLMIEAAKILKERGVNFVLDIVGDPANPEDVEYKKKLIEEAKGLPVNFLPGVPNDKTPEIYTSHEIFLNLTPSGSFDKTILEAVACGCRVLVMPNQAAEEIAYKIQSLLEAPSKPGDKFDLEKHSLSALINKLLREIQNG